jgi:DNA-binding IclR family transcriptional regulator
MYATAAGKAILAHLDPQETRDYFNSVPLIKKAAKTITDKKQLLKQLDMIRNGSPAYSFEEQFDGMIAISLPVFNHSGHVIASIVQPLPSFRYNTEKEQIILSALTQACHKLCLDLGYSP